VIFKVLDFFSALFGRTPARKMAKIEPEDIAREVHRLHHIHYPISTINAFLGGYLKRETLAYRVIQHTLHEAFGVATEGLEAIKDRGTR